jgi:hypothetical protein
MVRHGSTLRAMAQPEVVEVDAVKGWMYDCPTRYQSTNSIPSLMLACVARMNSFSSIFMVLLKSAIGGMVASPTPTVPISSDSISSMS